MAKQHLQLSKTQKSVKGMAAGHSLNMVWFVTLATFAFSSFFFFFGFFSGGRALTER